MAVELKITFTGGGNLGEDYVLDLTEPKLLGRTHAAAVVVSKSDGDVSGRHIEFRAEGTGVVAICLSHNGFLCNGEKVREGAIHPLKRGDELRIGKHVRIRVDRAGEVLAPGAERPTSVLDMVTQMTRTVGTLTERHSQATAATRFADSATAAAAPVTAATRFAGPATAPSFAGGSVVEAPVMDAYSNSVSVPTGGADDAATADEATTAPGGATVAAATHATAAATYSGPDVDAPSTDPASSDGETLAMQTRVGNMDVIRAIAEEKARAKRFRQRLLTAASFATLAFFAAIVYWRWPRAEGQLDHPAPIAHHYVTSATASIKVMFPKNARTRTSERPNGGIDVETMTGTARDVPYRLSFDVRRDAAEYGLSLRDSVARVLKALQTEGYVFESEGPKDGFRFFEGDYPKFCIPGGSQRGVRFYLREFTRSQGANLWHGFLLYFRDGDTAYRLLHEIPDPEWPRGGGLLRNGPNFILQESFLLNQWESPGRAALAGYASRDAQEMLKQVDAALERNLPNEWKSIGLLVDALVLRGRQGDARLLTEANRRLQRFRQIKDLFYDECAARRDCGFADEAFAKAWGAFGNDAEDLRSMELANPDKWSRE